MRNLRVWHLMVVVIAVGVLLAVAKDDGRSNPLAPVLIGSYLCGSLGLWGARRRGGRPRTGL